MRAPLDGLMMAAKAMEQLSLASEQRELILGAVHSCRQLETALTDDFADIEVRPPRRADASAGF